MLKLLILIFTLLTTTLSWAQNCDCTVTEVEYNIVEPCDLIIGTVDTVSTTLELRNAIIAANASGGNMTILLEDGTYQIASTAWYPYITASNVVFRSLSGNRNDVVWRGNGMVSVAPLVENGIFAVGNNITIADLTISDLGNNGIAVTGDSLFVHNVRIQNTFEHMIKGNNANGGADFARVQCSLFEYPSGVGPQWYTGGLDIHDGDSCVVNDNIFRNIASPSGSLAQHAVSFWNYSSDNIIERNLMINCDRGIGFGLGSSPSEGGIIRNNMIYNDGTGLFNDVGIGLETSPDTKVYNNTVIIDYPNAIEYRFPETDNVLITNNLTNRLIKSRNGGQATLATNVTDAQLGWFMDPSSGDLRLSSAVATVVGQGTDLFADVSMDIDQVPRPATPDIGAHQYAQPTGVTDVESSVPTISVFPNPASNAFILRTDSDDVADLRIYNVAGQMVLSISDRRLLSEAGIDISNLENGIYHCRVSDVDDKVQSVKLVVLR